MLIADWFKIDITHVFIKMVSPLGRVGHHFSHLATIRYTTAFHVIKYDYNFSLWLFWMLVLTDDENDIHGAILDLEKVSSYRKNELEYWLTCNGDIFKEISH